MLRLVGEGAGAGVQPSLGQPRALLYDPATVSSGDLETGNKTISVTSKPSTPTYSVSLNLPSPPEGIEVLRLAFYFRFNVASNSSSTVRYAVHINGTQVINGSRPTSFTGEVKETLAQSPGTGAITLGTNQVEIYLWMEPGGYYWVTDTVECALGVGSNSTTISGGVLRIYARGWISLGATLLNWGGGTPYLSLAPCDNYAAVLTKVTGSGTLLSVPAAVVDGVLLSCWGTSTTAINTLGQVTVVSLG